MINDLKVFREERHELIQLRQYLEYLGDRYDKVTQGLKTQSEEYQHAINEYGVDRVV